MSERKRTDGIVAESPLERRLRTIRRDRFRYSPEQVQWIRESYLIEGKSIADIAEQLWPRSTHNALWRIAVGRTYTDVPLSPRLEAAAIDAEEMRGVPTDAAPSSGQMRPASPISPPPARPATPAGPYGPTRAQELLEAEPEENEAAWA